MNQKNNENDTPARVCMIPRVLGGFIPSWHSYEQFRRFVAMPASALSILATVSLSIFKNTFEITIFENINVVLLISAICFFLGVHLINAYYPPLLAKDEEAFLNGAHSNTRLIKNSIEDLKFIEIEFSKQMKDYIDKIEADAEKKQKLEILRQNAELIPRIEEFSEYLHIVCSPKAQAALNKWYAGCRVLIFILFLLSAVLLLLSIF